MSALLDAVRQKYPQYADKSDEDLAFAIGSKYPTYLDKDEDFKKEFAVSRTKAELGLMPKPKTDLSQPIGEVQPGGAVLPMPHENDPERNRSELGKAFQSVLPQTSDQDRMTSNLRQMALAENVSPTPKAQVAQDLSEPPDEPSPVLAGAVKGIEGLADGFTSPVGIATLGIGALPRAAQKVISLAFAAQMAKQVPEIATQLGTEFGKPEAQRDKQKIAQLITEGAGTVGFTALAAKHGLTTEPTPQLQGPPAMGSMLKTPEGAKPLATIGDQLAAKGIEIPPVKPVAASEAQKPVQTPPVVQSAPKAAPVKFLGIQEAPAPMKSMELYNLTEDIPGHRKGSTVSRRDLEREGFVIPDEQDPLKNKAAQSATTVQPTEKPLSPDQEEQLIKKTGALRIAESRKDYLPAVKTRSGKIYTGEESHWANYDTIPKEEQAGAKNGYVDKQGNFLSLLDVARREENKGVATTQPPTEKPLSPSSASIKTAPTGKVEAVKSQDVTNEQKYQSGIDILKRKASEVNESRKSESYQSGDSLFASGIESLLRLAKVQGVEGELQLAGTGSQYLSLKVPTEFNAEGEVTDYETRKYRIANHDASVFREKQFGKNNGERIIGETRAEHEKAGEWLTQKIVQAAEDAWGNQPKTHPWNSENDFLLEETAPIAESGVATTGAKPKMLSSESSPKERPRELTRTPLASGEHPNTVVNPIAVKAEVAPKAEAKQLEMSRGPGAAAAGEPGTYSPIQRMADELRVTAGENKPIDDQLRAMDKVRAVGQDVKDSVGKALGKTKAVADAVWQKFKGLPEYGDEQKAVGKWYYALQRADHEARNFAKEVIRAVPSKVRREAITNWIQADGDNSVLQDRASKSTGSIRQGYEIAQKLTPREQDIAKSMRYYYDQQLERGLGEGIIKEGLENYITQVWKKENPITKKLVSELSSSKLQPNFKYARKRLFDSYFEGEQAGYVPNKDAGFLVANYDQQFNRSIAARAFIKDLHEGTASDGRPLVELSGNGKVIDDPKGAVMVKPKAKPEELADYRTIDHPALRGWKWATKTPEGKDVFVQGDMLVHPEAYQKLKNRLSVSAFRQNPVTRTLLNVQTGIKQTMLSVSGFHQVQETLHALGHRVNPMNLPEIDFSEPKTKALVEHGLQLADYDALNSFSEGLAGGGLMNKVPGIGPKLHAYNEWLFQDYIPRLKLQMGKLALERNREQYPKLAEDKLLELTANQANAAFGELPYKYWGRNPTLQDALRTFVLAPDFLEARARFVGQAVKPHGREQLVALGLLAATQYITARIVNQVLDKDPHWEPKNAFRIVAGKHAYGMRSVPGDLLHLFTDTRGFFYNRMSPLLRTAVEYVTGRDDKGVKKDLLEQAKDLAKTPIPISMKPRAGDKWWETFLNSFGVQEQRWDAVQTIGNKVAEFKKAHNIVSPVDIVYDREKDQYANLKLAIENSDEKTAKNEVTKLVKAGVDKSKIREHFQRSLTRPLTGSHVHEKAFLNSLDPTGKEEYKEAMDLRKARLEMVKSVLKQ